MSAPCFAGVCVLDNPFPIDTIYDYWIPPTVAEDIRPGVFVTVPFGVANRHRIALVCELRTTSQYKQHKSILSVCPEPFSLDEELLALCQFMKHRMLCSTGDAVRAMIPESALSRLITLYAPVTGNNTTDSDDASSSDLFVYEYLCRHGETPLSRLYEQCGKEIDPILRRLLSQGLITRRVILKDASAGLTERVWLPARPPEQLLSLAEGNELDGIRLRSANQKALLYAIATSDRPLTANDLKERLSISTSPLKALTEKGLLRTEERRLDRNPYATATYVGQTPLSLNDEQDEALERLSSLALSGKANAALLHGVTGSGKTVVITALIDRLLEKGRGVILLLPEIALTPQSVSIFCARYGSRVAVIHSALSRGERYDAYCRIRDGHADVVIGTRSAVFSPVRNLGAIIIDEEQEHTYKSDQNPKYHARDIARFRCAHNNALMLLASATPSLESYHKAKEGVYTLIRLKKRFGGATLPHVEITDLRHEARVGNLSPLGTQLTEELRETVARGEQAVLFLNRRGYNHFVSCRICGEAVLCPSCSVAMTYHTRRGTYAEGDLVCHWCGRRMPLPRLCPSCQSEHLVRMGFGTQRIEEELQKLLPSATVMRMDADTTASKFSYDTMLTDFREHRSDLLLGTQMVTKGHDFPDVTLVGVLLADASLYLDDYRASERTFSMLTQVIGRAGRRGDRRGLAVIQTNNPDSEIIRLACAQDYESFYEREIRLRRLLVFPPFCDIALLTLVGSVEDALLKGGTHLLQLLRELNEKKYPDVSLVTFGPFEAPVYRVDNKFRMRMVIKCRLNRATLALLSELVCGFWEKGNRSLSLSVDLNPSNL